MSGKLHLICMKLHLKLDIGKISENNSKIGKFIYSHNVSAYNGLFQV